MSLQHERLFRCDRTSYERFLGFTGSDTRTFLTWHEPHLYTAMESNEQEVYEMFRLFDKYVKNAPPKTGDK